MNETNNDESSLGYGLIRDNTKDKDMASVASVGYGLSAYVIGVENGYITYEEGKRRVIKTLQTFDTNIDHYEGFFLHFVDMTSGKPFRKSEFSTIDTTLFLNGALTCDAYFDEVEIHELFQRIFQRVNWGKFIHDFNGKKVFRMAYNPISGGDYRGESNDPWIYQWHMYAEQLSMYFLAAASGDISKTDALALFNGFERKLGKYDEFEYYYSPTNALFVYQFSHAWLDFKTITDASGIDWFENSKIATLANQRWCKNHQDQYKTISETCWGLTACLTPKGYRNQCIDPNDLKPKEEHVFGVLPPCGSLGSIVFTPNESKMAIEEIYKLYPKSFQDYGFTDGILKQNKKKTWISKDYVGINKGISLLMIDNYLHGTTWKYYMKHPLIQKALQKLNFERKQ